MTAPTTEDDKHGWDHPQCTLCWLNTEGMERQPARVKEPELSACCFCGHPTISGIFRRERPGSAKIPFCADAQIDRSIFGAVP